MPNPAAAARLEGLLNRAGRSPSVLADALALGLLPKKTQSTLQSSSSQNISSAMTSSRTLADVQQSIAQLRASGASVEKSASLRRELANLAFHRAAPSELLEEAGLSVLSQPVEPQNVEVVLLALNRARARPKRNEELMEMAGAAAAAHPSNTGIVSLAINLQSEWKKAAEVFSRSRIALGDLQVDAQCEVAFAAIQAGQWEAAVELLSRRRNDTALQTSLANAMFTAKRTQSKSTSEMLTLLLSQGESRLRRPPTALELTAALGKFGVPRTAIDSVTSVIFALETASNKATVPVVACSRAAWLYFWSIGGTTEADVLAIRSRELDKSWELSLKEQLLATLVERGSGKAEDYSMRFELGQELGDMTTCRDSLMGLQEAGYPLLNEALALSQRAVAVDDPDIALAVVRDFELWDLKGASDAVGMIVNRRLTKLQWSEAIAVLQSGFQNHDEKKTTLVLNFLGMHPLPQEGREAIRALLLELPPRSREIAEVIAEDRLDRAQHVAAFTADDTVRSACAKKIVELSLTANVFPDVALPLLRKMSRNVMNESLVHGILQHAMIAGDWVRGLEYHSILRRTSPLVCRSHAVRDLVNDMVTHVMAHTSIAQVAAHMGLKVHRARWDHAVVLFERFSESKMYTPAFGELDHLVNAVRYSYLSLGRWEAALKALLKPSTEKSLPTTHQVLLSKLTTTAPQAGSSAAVGIAMQDLFGRTARPSKPTDQRGKFIRVSEDQRSQIEAIMRRHARNGKWQEASSFVSELRSFRVDYQDCAMHSMVAAYNRSGHWEKAIEVYESLMKHSRWTKPDSRVAANTVAAANSAGAWQATLGVLKNVTEISRRPSPHVAILALRGLMGAGVSNVALEGARLVMHVKHPVLSDAVLECMVRCARWNEAVRYFNTMITDGVKPQENSIELTLAACAEARRQCDELAGSAAHVQSLLSEIMTLSEPLLEHIQWVQKLEGFTLKVAIERL